MIKKELQKERNANDLYILTEPLDTTNKIVIDIEEVADYCFCPQYYRFKHNNTDTINMRTLYDKAIHRTFYSYLISFQEGKLKSTLGFLKYQWGKEWIKSKSKSNLLVTPSSLKRDSYDEKRRLGIKAIFNFDEIMSSEKQIPIVINHKYEIEILPNIILRGTWEYIREVTLETGGKVIQIVKILSESNRFYTSHARQNDITLVADAYAFMKLFNPTYFQVVNIDVSNKKSFISTYTEKDFDKLKQTIQSVVTCIQNDINCWTPDIKCYNCEFRNDCNRLFQ